VIAVNRSGKGDSKRRTRSERPPQHWARCWAGAVAAGLLALGLDPATSLAATAGSPAAVASISVVAAPAKLGVGNQGAEVTALQDQLIGLGYWLGEPDGVFDQDTKHALVAFQKLAGLTRDGVLGPRTQAALDGAERPAARSSQGHVVEIDLTHQVLMVVDQGVVSEVFDTSTGRRSGITPVGTWSVNREIDGPRRAPLGLLYRPKYFRGGVAIHGYTSVPSQPASHGCVRVTYPAMDHLWDSGAVPLGTAVAVYR
jgi:hypothetical protein